MKFKKSVVKNSAIILFITLFIFAGMELSLRQFYEGMTVPTPIDPTLFSYEYHPEYAVQMKKNYTKVFKRSKVNGGDLIKWSTNSYGFRGKEIYDSNAIRVMVFGDSNVQGRFSKLNNTYCEQLDSVLTFKFNQEVEVINAGIIGFGPDQSYLKMSLEAEIYNPDIILFHVFADNDYGDIIRNRLFHINVEGELVKTTFPITVDQKLDPSPIKKPTFRIIELIQDLKSRGFNYDSLSATEKSEYNMKLYLDLCNQEFEVFEDEKGREFSHFDDHYDIDLAINPQSKAARVKVQLMNRILNAAKSYSTSIDAEFIVIIQPSSIDLTENYDLSYSDLKQFEFYKPERLSLEVENICKENNIRYVNLFQSFTTSDPSKLFFKSPDNHWNDLGQKIAAVETSLEIIKVE